MAPRPAKRTKAKTNAGKCPITSSVTARRAALELTKPIKEKFPAGVSQPALRALAREGYSSLQQLVKANESDLAKLHGMGPKALGIFRDALKKQGLSFRS